MDEEAIAAEAAEKAEANVPAAESYGIKSVLDGVVVLLIPLLFLARVVLPESPWSKFGLHLSCDAATLRNAPRKFKSVTTVMLRALCCGFAARYAHVKLHADRRSASGPR